MNRTLAADLTTVLSSPPIPSGLTRARRTAGAARATMGVAGLLFSVLWPPAGTSPLLAEIGFGIIVVTSVVQLLAPRQEWVQVGLDRSLISGIDTDPDRGALVTALLGYARQTGGHLVAEGVETEAELETLEVLGVDLVQGFLLARPGWPWPEVRQRDDRGRAGRSLAARLPN